MSRSWIRRELTRAERLTNGLASVAVGAAAGALVWYLGRILVAREPLALRPERAPDEVRALPPGRDSP